MEERFPFRKPPIGRSKGFVVLNGELRLEHPLIKVPLVVATRDIAAVVRMTESENEEPLLRRDPRVLDLAGGVVDSNVFVVFRRPVRIERFTFGAENGLPISRRERKRGVEVDAVGLRMEEPDALTAALWNRGVQPATRLGLALSDVIGEPTGLEAVQRQQERRRGRARARLGLIGFGVLWTSLLAARFAFGGDGEDVPWTTAGGLVASSLAWAALISLVVAVTTKGANDRRAIRDRWSGWHALGALAAVTMVFLIPIVVAGLLSTHLGTPRVLAYGLVAGAPGGLMWGFALRGS
jgi:hypothetical protein